MDSHKLKIILMYIFHIYFEAKISPFQVYWIDFLVHYVFLESNFLFFFNFQRKSLEQELSQGSVLALPIAILVGVAIYNYQKVKLRLSQAVTMYIFLTIWKYIKWSS